MTGFSITALVVYLVSVNALAFAAFGVDKARAKRGAWRISEKALMLLAIAGGSLGALAGMYVFHHKTRKPLFSVGVPVLLAITLAALVAFGLAGCHRQQEPSTDFQNATVEYVVDGDTIDVMIDGHEKRVRLAGIDAPESASHEQERNTQEGVLATEHVRALLPIGRVVYLQKDVSETDKYGRLVRYVWLEIPSDPFSSEEIARKMANSLIVESGFARAERFWPDVSYADQLKEAQKRAVDGGLGVSYLWRES